jgi:hypothetical protein
LRESIACGRLTHVEQRAHRTGAERLYQAIRLDDANSQASNCAMTRCSSSATGLVSAENA